MFTACKRSRPDFLRASSSHDNPSVKNSMSAAWAVFLSTGPLQRLANDLHSRVVVTWRVALSAYFHFRVEVGVCHVRGQNGLARQLFEASGFDREHPPPLPHPLPPPPMPAAIPPCRIPYRHPLHRAHGLTHHPLPPPISRPCHAHATAMPTHAAPIPTIIWAWIGTSSERVGIWGSGKAGFRQIFTIKFPPRRCSAG